MLTPPHFFVSISATQKSVLERIFETVFRIPSAKTESSLPSLNIVIPDSFAFLI